MDRILKRIKKERVLIIGIGNRLKGDDGVGSILAEKLKEKNKKENLLIIDAENMPENYIGIIRRFSPSLILIIDAIDFGSFSGDFRIFEIKEIKDTTFSTHNFSILLFKKLINKSDIYLLGIQPENLNLQEGLSYKVNLAIEKIIEKFKNFLS
ncbi:MAG: hydrogenase maturation protease [Candidatus Omnitrophica bacterium]|nr:hydrogenase maturation protease [Candidatus Omnitrophota bacterium]